jgi:site-specific DNA-methyltransferase (adenine-specific)
VTPYYEQDGITIFHGDCRDGLASIECDLLLADPPYGVSSLTQGGAGGSASIKMRGSGCDLKKRSVEAVTGNDRPFDPMHLLAFPKVILWGANHYAQRLPPASCWIAWDKREGQTSDRNADCELAWTNLRGPARLYSQLWRGMVRRGEENGRERVHPTQKPIALMKWCIELAKLTPNSYIVDPYMGSGTAVIAAWRLGHRAIGIEIEERYCEIAAKRLQQGALPMEFTA